MKTLLSLTASAVALAALSAPLPALAKLPGFDRPAATVDAPALPDLKLADRGRGRGGDDGDGRGRGRGGDDDRKDDRGGRDRDRDRGEDGSGSGRSKPRVPGGSGCDDAGDIAEHSECRG